MDRSDRVKVHFIGTFNGHSQRVKNLVAMLDTAGFHVTIATNDVWGRDLYKTINRRIVRRIPKIIWGLIRTVPTALRTRADAVVVCYPGYLDMLIIAPIARMRGIPVVYDPYISLYDTAVMDRQLIAGTSLIARLFKVIEKSALRRADLVLADTPQHSRLYQCIAGRDLKNNLVVWLGANEDLFLSAEVQEPELTSRSGDNLTVFFHGTFVPLQGVAAIVDAARILQGENFQFRIAGDGQDSKTIRGMVADYGLSNLTLLGMLNQDDLVHELKEADVCLGIFGQSEKASRVVPNKVFECAAAGRPIITRDSPAIRDAFSEAEIVMCRPGDPESLAEKIRGLEVDQARRIQMGANVQKAFIDRFSIQAQSTDLADHIKALTGRVR